MLIIDSLDRLSDAPSGLAYAIGNFDGFHLGHLALLAKAKGLGSVGLITFEPHPRQVFAPDTSPQRLMADFDKHHAAEAFGVEVYCQLPFSQDFAALSAEAFHEQVLSALRPSAIITGKDFQYGKDRCGNLGSLAAAAGDLGFDYHAVDKVSGEDIGVYSSTVIRGLISAGKIAEANAALCRDWSVTSVVERGDQIGRTIGFPTANLSLGSYQRPAQGIYAVKVGIGDEPKHRMGAAYYGFRPSLDGQEERFEVHLLDFDADIYDQTLRVEFIEHIRGDKKLDGLDALKAQIAEDCQACRQVLEQA